LHDCARLFSPRVSEVANPSTVSLARGSLVDEILKSMAEQCNTNKQRFEELQTPLIERYETISERRNILGERWKASGPHSKELDAKLREMLNPAAAAIFDFAQIRENRVNSLIPLSRATAKIRNSSAKRKLPILEEFLTATQWDLDEGLTRRKEILDRYEEAVQHLEDFFDKEVPSLSQDL
jgi:hypothetical protein